MDPVRLRLAFGRLDWKSFSLVAGQDWSVCAVEPDDAGRVRLSASGNTWIRMPLPVFITYAKALMLTLSEPSSAIELYAEMAHDLDYGIDAERNRKDQQSANETSDHENSAFGYIFYNMD